MGRGRAKAKQVKVARRLKYSSGGTDLDRLKEELGVDSSDGDAPDDSFDDDLSDKYSDYVDQYGDKDDSGPSAR